MLRSLIAVVIAVLLGVIATRLVETAAFMATAPVEGAGHSTDATAAAHPGFNIGLLLAWGAGAFAASAVALLIGRRWAPLGVLAAASIALFAGVTILEASLSWWMWPASLLATAISGGVPIYLLRALRKAPFSHSPRNSFGL